MEEETAREAEVLSELEKERQEATEALAALQRQQQEAQEAERLRREQEKRLAEQAEAQRIAEEKKKEAEVTARRLQEEQQRAAAERDRIDQLKRGRFLNWPSSRTRSSRRSKETGCARERTACLKQEWSLKLIRAARLFQLKFIVQAAQPNLTVRSSTQYARHRRCRYRRILRFTITSESLISLSKRQ